jgi:lambda family phage portal protein
MAKPLSLVRRFGAGVKAFSAGFGAGISTFQPYEAAGFSRKRPVIYGAHARDSKADLNEGTRVELLKLARHMYRNVGLIKGAVDSIATYSVGPGLRPQYRGKNAEFGTLCEEYWRDVVTPNPEVTGRMTWADLLMALSRSIDVDGDVFIIMTENGKLQVVEGHRVCEADEYGTADGVFLGKLGEPTAYLIQTGDDYRKIQAEAIMHLMEIERPDQIRGGSSLARALNHVRDLKMLGEFEKDALKLQGSIAAVITTAEGDALANTGGFFGNIQPLDTGESSIAREEITSSATIPRLGPGEKIEMVSPTRPNSSFEPFAKFLIRDVAMGLGLPVEFVYDPASVGGAGMRFVVAKAQRRFEQRQRLLIDRFCNRAWRYFIGTAIANGDLPADEDYAKVTWQTPKSLTVDAGREAQQERENYKAGLSSLQSYFGELGLDWEEQTRQIAKEKEFIASLGTVAPEVDEAAPVQPVDEAPAVDEEATEEIKDPNAGPNTELSAKGPETVKELEQEMKVLSESFTMKDDPDYNLSDKELQMISDALGLKKKEKIELAKRPGPKSASQTPAPASERKKGSKANPAGTASTRSKAGDIEISEAVEQTLKNKIADFKKRNPNRKAPSLGALKKVFRRGAGAFSTSFRPTIGGGRPNSRTAWAIARVNKFLKMAGGGEVKKSYREADGDLL